MGFRFTLYSTWCVVSRAPRGPRERWLQVLDGMRRQRGIRTCYRTASRDGDRFCSTTAKMASFPGGRSLQSAYGSSQKGSIASIVTRESRLVVPVSPGQVDRPPSVWIIERARRAERPKKQGSDRELFLVARVAIKYAGQSHFYRVISVASNALLSNAVWVTCRAYLEDRKKKRAREKPDAQRKIALGGCYTEAQGTRALSSTRPRPRRSTRPRPSRRCR